MMRNMAWNWSPFRFERYLTRPLDYWERYCPQNQDGNHSIHSIHSGIHYLVKVYNLQHQEPTKSRRKLKQNVGPGLEEYQTRP